MASSARVEPVDYLAIGHITIDDTPSGPRIGGSAAYAALAAQALGMNAGIFTAWGEELPLGLLQDIPIVNIGADASTRFENTYGPLGRSQRVLQQAPFLEFHMLPEAWRDARILHLAPVAREVSPRILKYFDEALIGVTPQGWLREWDESGCVQTGEWIEAEHVLGRADACIVGLEDLQGDLARVEQMAAVCPILVVTEGKIGATLYMHGEEHKIVAPEIEEVDPTGAGDIFAAAFLVRLHLTGDALDAARFATQLAALSVQRAGLDSTPTRDEIYDLMAEAL
jgi:sugar/nucleoside kinase (ribokinase family)